MRRNIFHVIAAGGFLLGCFLLTIVPFGCASEDTRKTTEIYPGVYYTVIHRPAAPNYIHVVEIHRDRAVVGLQAIKAGRFLRATMPLSEALTGIEPLAAINGDFFSQEGAPSGAQISEGEPVKDGAESWYALGVAGKEIFIDRVHFTGQVFLNNEKSFTINGFNRPRQDKEIIYYNAYYGTSSGTNPYGVELVLRKPTNGMIVGNSAEYKLLDIDSTGNHSITDSTAVLSFHGDIYKNIIRDLRLGQSITISIESEPAHGSIPTLIGGFPLLVRKKQNMIASEVNRTSFYTDANARTAVGYSAESIFLVCVDGDQPNYSVGMSLDDLAELMIELGCEDALNLDGGGSTTMRIRGQLANRPSGGGLERNISNALVVMPLRQ
ncbi:phosphodiester glycosidase family protein [bacterium]|nr:phosphodiester glycosidase family protein [bacterium]